MSEIFLQEDITSLLDNRFIVIIGDSIQRGVYKDLVLLLQKNRYLCDSHLRAKGEFTFSGDRLIEGGQYGEMSNGVKYREVRQYQTDFHLVRFYFVTRCYNRYMESILEDLSKEPVPDVVLMNSCLWDISRYGNGSVDEYKVNLDKLFTRMKKVLPESCLFIWNMTLPISKMARGGFLIPQVEYMNSSLRLDILEANFYTHRLALLHGFNTLDLHYYLRHQLQRRAGDGVHWDVTAHRRMTNLILSHIAEAWGEKPPHNARTVLTMNNNNGEAADSNTNQPKQFLGKDFSGFQSYKPSSTAPASFKTNQNPMPNELGQFLVHVDNQQPNRRAVDMNNINPVMNQAHMDSVRRDNSHYNGMTSNQNGMPMGYIDFDSVDMSGMMPINQMFDCQQLPWEPYRNEEFQGQMSYGVSGAGNQNRNVPYYNRMQYM